MTAREHLFLSILVPVIAAGTLHCSAQEVVEVSERNSGQAIVMAQGSTLNIRLETIPGTGFGWQLVKHDARLLRLLGDSVGPQGTAQQVGAKEVHRFVFEALGAGRTELELAYARSWEKEIPPLKSYRIIVEIR